MTDQAPCLGSTHLLFPEDDLDPELRAPEFCSPAVCPMSLDCARQGWSENFGMWGGLRLIDRLKAKKDNLTVEEAWTMIHSTDT